MVFVYRAPNPTDYYRPRANSSDSTNTIGYLTDTEMKARRDELFYGALLWARDHIDQFIDVDLDNDGFIDNVTFILRGLMNDSNPNNIFPIFASYYSHSTAINICINEKRINSYCVNVEGVVWTRQKSAVSVMGAEFTHSLGFPDLYSAGFREHGIIPVGFFDVHGGAQYRFETENDTTAHPPKGMCAYSRWKYVRNNAWGINIETITESGSYSLEPLIYNPATHAYRINSPYSQEYFIVEYRINTGDWIDTYYPPNFNSPADTLGLGIPESGLVIYRVNESISGNYSGNFELYTYRPNGTTDTNGNLYCAQYAADITSQYNFETTRIDRDTNPSPFLTNGIYGGLTINNIGVAGPTITFDVTINQLSTEVYVHPIYGDDPDYPDHYVTIQEAINECGPDGTVYIYPGIYSGEGNREIKFNTIHNITVTRMEDETDPVVLDCEGFDGFSINNIGNTYTISNLELVNARLGISIYNATVTLDNVTFYGQTTAVFFPTAIFVSNTDEVTIKNCRFIGGYYGRIINSSSINLTLLNNRFEDMTAYLNIMEDQSRHPKLIDIKAENLVMENNVFQNIYGDKYNAVVNIECLLPLTDTSNISIVKNQFINNRVLVDEDSSDPVVNISLQKVQNCPSIMIKENIFMLHDAAFPIPYTNINIEGLSSASSFVSYYNNTEIGFGENDGTSIRLSVQGALTTIKNSIFTGKVKSALLGGPTVITNSWIFNNRLPE
ncbi:MAG: hypothetical protein FWG20_04475, partial [Candidatus Cloacimonetes bacterium]|nr:hypothetical protein [Candidatus Cloacimonadota bacterium]